MMTFEEFKAHAEERYEKELKHMDFDFNATYAPTMEQQHEMLALLGIDPNSDWAQLYGDKMTGGFTAAPEIDNVEHDIVEVFFGGIEFIAQVGALGTSTVEEVVDEIITHEFRHALQVVELRKLGLLERAYDLEKGFQYGHGPMESDAILAQKGRAIDISVFISCVQDLLG